MFDRHGSVDVMLEVDWLNLVMSTHHSGIEAYTDEKNLEITGASLNTLLLGVIIYHGYVKPSPQELYGGMKVWSHCMEHMLIMLPNTATIPEVMVRIIYILQGFLMEVHMAEEMVKAHIERSERHKRSPTDLSNLWYGSINFLRYWVSSYNEYFSDLQLRELEQGVRDMCTRLSAKERVRNLPFLEQEIDKSAKNIALIDLTAHLCMKLQHQVKSIGRARSWHSQGFGPPSIPGHISSRTNIAIALPFSNLAPSIPQLQGNWAGNDKEKNKRAYREAVNSAALQNMGVFGGADNLANFDSSDEEDDVEKADPNDLTQSDDVRLEIRVPKGFCLKGRDCMDFWSLDSLEMARQWTLSDHKLFQSIPPHNILNCSWGEARHRLSAQNIRRFIDRFNAASNWTTSSVLTGKTPENRAFIYEYIVKLGLHFRNLHNFHSLMAVLTGLQRGAISRLRKTLELVSSSVKDALKHLLKDMDGTKNYVYYRSIMERFLHKKNNVGAFIPHLGAHLAEITSIDEGNPDHLPNSPHLLNVAKLKLSARTFSNLADLQKFKYNLTPARIIACAIDKALQPFVILTQARVAEKEKAMFDLSLSLESPPLPLKPTHIIVPGHRDHRGSVDDDDDEDGDSSESSGNDDDSHSDYSSEEEGEYILKRNMNGHVYWYNTTTRHACEHQPSTWDGGNWQMKAGDPHMYGGKNYWQNTAAEHTTVSDTLPPEWEKLLHDVNHEGEHVQGHH